MSNPKLADVRVEADAVFAVSDGQLYQRLRDEYGAKEYWLKATVEDVAEAIGDDDE